MSLIDRIVLVFFILNIRVHADRVESFDDKAPLNVIPDWTGSFYTTTECDESKCCCIYGLLTLSKMKPNYLRIQGQLQGYNCPPDSKIDSIITMPTGFQTEISLMGGLVDLTLSEDSRTITLSNQRAPDCSGHALRNDSTSMKSINSWKIMFIFATMWTLLNCI